MRCIPTNAIQSIKSSWKPGYLVLRPNLLSVYKDEENTSLRLSLTLSEVTAVAPVRSPRSRRQHVFGVFTPSKNYRFQAITEKDAEDWIERIRSETRIDEEDEALLAFTRQPAKHQQRIDDISEQSDLEDIRTASSPELGRELSPKSPSTRFFGAPGYSTNDVTSFSEWSDGPTPNVRVDSMSSANELSTSIPAERQRPTSRDDDFGVLRDPERVLCHGFLQGLRIEGGVRQWKRRWAVLRPKSLAFYKDEQEYSAIKIIPMSQVVDAAEIDPLSRTKELCFQIIAEEKTFRLCAPDEQSFAQWLGCLKSIIVATRKKSKIAPFGAPLA